MASVVGHAAVALALGTAFQPSDARARFWTLGVICAVLPDVDVVAFWFNVPYEHVLGHRGLSHSLLFAAVLGGVVAWLFFRKPRWWLVVYFFLATASHGVLDAMTDGGSGVAFFAPFDNSRFFLPWRPITVSPIGIRHFFGEWGLAVLASELRWVLTPSALFALGVWTWRRAR